MPIPSPADFRNKTKKHSEVREMLAQMAENVESKEDATTKANAAKTEAISAADNNADIKINTALNKSSGTFDTFAALELSPLIDGAFALVANDTDPTKNGHYKKGSGAWTKVAYDPVAQAKEYADIQASNTLASAKAHALAQDDIKLAAATTYTDNKAITTLENAALDATNKANMAQANAVAQSSSYADSAQASADSAATSASAAAISAGVYATAEAGVAAGSGVAVGEYYSVRSTNQDYYIDEYQNVDGVAVPTGKSYLSSVGMGKVSVYTTQQIISFADNYALNTRFNTHGFYNKGDCLTTTFEVQAVSPDDVFTDIGNGVLIGVDASIKVSASKKLKLIANNSVCLSQLGGVKTSVSTAIKNDVVATAILKNFYELIVDGFYTIRGTIWHYKNNSVRGIGKLLSGLRMADNINKYPIQSFYSNIKAEVFLNDYFEMSHFTLDGNEAKNRVRGYTKDINLSYWGFGVAIFNTNDFYPHDMLVKSTEAWGISYHLCNIVRGINLEFDQLVEVGNNKDGITGSGKRVTYKNIKGYTSDDLCAVSTGKSSLGGVDTGIAVNMEVIYIDISDVDGLSKNGQGTHYGIGIYGPDNQVINKVTIDNVRGNFKQGAIRIKNYWYVANNLKIKDIKISNIGKSIVQNTTGEYILWSLVDTDKAVVDWVHYYKSGDVTRTGGAILIDATQSTFKNLTFKNIKAEQIGSTQNITLLYGTFRTTVEHLIFENIEGVTSEIIPDDNDVTFGCLLPSSGISKPTKSFVIKKYAQGGFKFFGYLRNIISTRGTDALDFRVDEIDYPENDSRVIAASPTMSIISSKLKVIDSVLYISVVADINLTPGNLTQEYVSCFTLGAQAIFPSSLLVTYANGVTAASNNLKFIQRGSQVQILRPSASGVTSPGVYRCTIYGALNNL